jgi:RNA polymerase sigma-70 factor, ECF subfamily
MPAGVSPHASPKAVVVDSTSDTLLERLKRGHDADAWRRFVEIYTPLVYCWARRAGLQPHDAADLVQDVLTLLLEKLPQFTAGPQSSFRGWLRTVTRNRWQEKRRRKTLPQAAADEPLVDRAAPEPMAELGDEEYRQHLVASALRIMQTHFETNTWRACWETVVAGRPAAEVAAELGLSEAAVYMAKSRVLKRLRQDLAGLWE